MKLLIAATLLAATLAAAPAHARKDCEELKREIAAKIDANGVKAYSLEVVAADAEVSAKVVGSCNGGAKRIVYQRDTATPAALVAAKPE